MITIPIKDHYSAAELRALARSERTGRVRARMLAIAACLEGVARARAAALAGMSRNVLRIWIDRYNEAGVAGLRDRRHPGRPSEITPEQRAKLRARVLEGAEPDRDGVTAFRIADIRRIGREEFDIDASWSTIRRIMIGEGLAWLCPRPQHPDSDREAQEAFKKTSPMP